MFYTSILRPEVDRVHRTVNSQSHRSTRRSPKVKGGTFLALLPYRSFTARQEETINRGLIAIRRRSTFVYVSCRLPATGTGSAVRIAEPITATTDYTDRGRSLSSPSTYHVRPVINGVEQAPRESFPVAANSPLAYLALPIQKPAGGTTPVCHRPYPCTRGSEWEALYWSACYEEVMPPFWRHLVNVYHFLRKNSSPTFPSPSTRPNSLNAKNGMKAENTTRHSARNASQP